MTLEEQAEIKYPMPKNVCNRIRSRILEYRRVWIKKKMQLPLNN